MSISGHYPSGKNLPERAAIPEPVKIWKYAAGVWSPLSRAKDCGRGSITHKAVEKTTRQTVKDKALAASLGTGIIPDKLYFKIGEVKKITGVETHVLRYWESEFKIIRPQRASSRQRLYRRADVENILTIKKLLYEDGYTVPGARKLLTAKKGTKKKADKVDTKFSGARARTMLTELKSDLKQLQELLEKK